MREVSEMRSDQPERDDPAAARSTASVWSPLRRPVFRALWTATVFSNIGVWMHDVGAGWLMTSLAPTPSMVALVQGATTLPVFLLAFFSGALADIVDRRRLLIAVQLWMCLCAALLAFLTLTGATNAWLLLVITFALGVGTALMMPAWAAITAELVPAAELQAAVALNSMGINVARAVGPAVGGLIIAASTPGLVFALNAASYLGVVYALFRWQPARERRALPAERFLGALAAGIRYVRYEPRLQAVLVRGAGFFIFGSASWAFLPLIARQELGGGASLYGVLVGCIGVGAVGGAVALPKLRARLDRDALVAAATVLYACAALALAWVREVYVLGVVMVATGAAWLAVLSSLQVAAQTALPAWVRARGLAAHMVVFMGSMAAGSILWGNVGDRFGIGVTLTVAAVGALAAMCLTWRFKIGEHEGIDLAPSMHWPTPLIDPAAAEDEGPVLVRIEYTIDPEQASEFLAAMQALRRLRLRDGAFSWTLYRDAKSRERFVEAFLVESWLEHLRQHQRFTHADLDVEAAAKVFHRGATPQLVEHMLAQSLRAD